MKDHIILKTKALSSLSLFVTLLLVTLGSLEAQAVVVMGWERPIMQSRMVTKIATGDFVEVVEADVVLTKLDHVTTVTGVTVSLIDFDVQIFFEVLEVQKTPYGYTRIVARHTAEYASVSEGGSVGNMDMYLLVSHDTDAPGVEYGRPHPVSWEVHIKSPLIESESELVLTGRPQPVYTIQREGSRGAMTM